MAFRQRYRFGYLASIVSVVLCCIAIAQVNGTDYYPYEPIYVTTETPVSEIDKDFSLPCVINTPSGNVWTNYLTRGNLVGRQRSADGSVTNTLFFVNINMESNHNVFGEVGEYRLELEGSTSSVQVVSPANEEIELIDLIKGDMLPRIAVLSNGNDCDEVIKARCIQILKVSGSGRYAEYARAYLGVDEFYQVIHPDAENLGQFPPDFSAINVNLASLSVSRPVLKQMVLFHLGYAEGLAKQPSAINTLRSLIDDFPYSRWSIAAKAMLIELEE